MTERFGLRKIEIRGRSLLLNGKPLKLLGVNRHEHHPDFGYALPDAIHVNDLMLMKQCGCTCPGFSLSAESALSGLL